MNTYKKISKLAKSLGRRFPYSFRVEFSEYVGTRFIDVNVLKWHFGSTKAHYLEGEALTAYNKFCRLCNELCEGYEEPDEVSTVWDFPDFHVILDTASIG